MEIETEMETEMEVEAMASTPVTRSFDVRGKVQRAMFRQTVIRAAIKRSLVCGATNDKADRSLVHLTLQGPASQVQELVNAISSGQELNDWGARATTVTEMEATTNADEAARQLAAHQVTTANVNDRQWNPNCVMYI